VRWVGFRILNLLKVGERAHPFWACACNEKNRIDSFKREQVKENGKMLWTIFVILLVMWLLGLVTSYTLGGFIHLLLVLAVVVLVINLIQGRRVV
jgi:hypothetical protein